jgi:hypothetical protein
MHEVCEIHMCSLRARAAPPLAQAQAQNCGCNREPDDQFVKSGLAHVTANARSDRRAADSLEQLFEDPEGLRSEVATVILSNGKRSARLQ